MFKNTHDGLRPATVQDAAAIVAVYNSNPGFLCAHLRRSAVDEAFVLREMAETAAAGFISAVVLDAVERAVIGVLDYKPADTVYLSLLMLRAAKQGKGAGTALYQDFEQVQRREGKREIRIDVVNDYPDNLVGFWQKRGFIPQRTIWLEWGGKRSRALVMKKPLTAADGP